MTTKHFLSVVLFTLLTLTAALTVFASEPCRNWDGAGHWELKQSNGFIVMMQVSQKGIYITGRAQYGGHSGTVDGNLGGASWMFQIHWDDGKVGVYEGSIAQDGS